MEKEIIKAVHDTDLKELIEKLNLQEKLQQGLLKCEICKKTITYDNLQGIYKDKSEMKFVCDDLECYKKIIEEKS